MRIHAKHDCSRFCTSLCGYSRLVCLGHLLVYLENHAAMCLRASRSAELFPVLRCLLFVSPCNSHLGGSSCSSPLFLAVLC